LDDALESFREQPVRADSEQQRDGLLPDFS